MPYPPIIAIAIFNNKKDTTMQKLFGLSIIMLLFLVACNSGSNSKADAAGTDTTAMPPKDTSHAGMDMNTVAPLPEIPAGAKVFFKNLKDGETVKSPFKVEMGAVGIKVDTAGMPMAGSGHHHLYIDAGDSAGAGLVVPKDSTHLHFGKAQTETTLTLPAGKHRLALQFADGLHRSYGGKLSAAITVNVKK
jgi:hypothetical protein